MSSHVPYPQEKEEEAPPAGAPTAPAGKYQESVPPCAAATAPAGIPDKKSSNGNSPNPTRKSDGTQEMTVYTTPISVEAAAAPPVRTYVETTQSVARGSEVGANPHHPHVATAAESTREEAAFTDPSHATSKATSPNENVVSNRTLPASADGVSVTTTITRVTTLQPCKIVYYYADNTSHTYVLQNTTTLSAGVHGSAAAVTAATAGVGDALYTPPTEGPSRQSEHHLRKRRGLQQQTHQRGGGNGGRYAGSPHRLSTTRAARIPNSHGGDSSSLVSFDSGTTDDDEDHHDDVDDLENGNLLVAGRESGGDGRTPKHDAVQLLAPTVAGPPCASCGQCACLATVYKPPEYVSDITPANPRIGSPGPVTLFAFGFTTCLYNVHQAGICPMNLTTMGLICFYGGLAQFVGGFFELINKNTIFCTLDVTYGAFWMATAVTNLVPENDNVVAAAPKNYMGGFFMLWFFFAGTMFASSFKFSYVQMLLNFSVTLNFFLNFLGSFIGSKTLLHVAGYEGIVEGCLATYVGMAFTMRDIYGHSILPLFFQKNFRITEW